MLVLHTHATLENINLPIVILLNKYIIIITISGSSIQLPSILIRFAVESIHPLIHSFTNLYNKC